MTTYDPGKVFMMWGPIPISGFAAGSMVNVQHQGEGVKAETGTAGETAFVESYDKRGTVTIRLMATSPINAILSAAYQAGNLPVFLAITSLSTAAVHAAGEAKIQRPPDTDYGAEVPVREWVFIVPKLDDLG